MIQYKHAINDLLFFIFYFFSPLPPDRYVLVGSRHDNDQGGGASAIMNQLIAALTEQTKRGWVPDRTTVFCSWGGTALGNVGSYEWGKVSEHESICFTGIVWSSWNDSNWGGNA